MRTLGSRSFRNRPGLAAALVALVAGSLLPATVSAQAVADEARDGEIIVTATKTGQTVTEAPVSVGVVTAETIRAFLALT